METVLLQIIERGTLPQRYKTSVGQFIRAPDGRQIRLQGPDNKLTPEGGAYWRLRGIPAPSLYSYDQPLQNDTHVTAYDSSRIKVRAPTTDGGWRITSKGEGYFRYNPTEYLANVPYLLLKGNRITRPAAGVANEWYMALRDWFAPDQRIRDLDPIPTTVSKVREARERGRRLAATPAQQLAEVRESVLKMLRDPSSVSDVQMARYRRIQVNDTWYTELGQQSDLSYLWDETRPLVIDQRRTQFYDDRKPTTETILGRPLRRWALPDGMWRPFDMHPDTFEEFDHGCCVQMLFKSFTRRPNGSEQRKGIKVRAPILTVSQIEEELEACFRELEHEEGKFPFSHDWKTDGVTAGMVIQFCKRQSKKGKPLKCYVFHKGRKIAEFTPENATKDSPTVAFAVFGHHAYFYGNGDAITAAAKTEEAPTQQSKYDEFSGKSLREPYPHFEMPAFSEWREDWELFAALEDGFEAFEKEYTSKKRRLGKCDSKEFVVFKTDDINATLEHAKHIQERLQGSGRCFAIRIKYGKTPDQKVGLQLDVKGCPKIRVKPVCEHAHLMQLIAEKLGLGKWKYRGESYAAFGENLRLALSKQRRDIPASTRQKVIAKYKGCCAACGEESSTLELDHITAVADGGGNEPENLQPLCGACHATRSEAQRLTTFANAWYSELSAETLDALLEADKPQQLVFGDGTTHCLELDVAKCRRWAIEKASTPLPVACVLDDVRPYDGKPADFVFVDAGPPDATDYSKFVVYQGPRWMTWELAQWGLDHCIFQEEKHFIAVFRTTSHVGTEVVRAAYADMEGAMSEALHDVCIEGLSLKGCSDEDRRKCDAPKQELFKKIFLAMQGSWLIQHQYTWSAVDSPCMDDAPGRVERYRDLDDCKGTMRWFSVSETLSNRTMYLWGLYSLNREHLLVAKAIELTRTIPKVSIHGVLVDALLIKVPTKVKPQIKESTHAHTATHDDGHPLFHLKDKDRTGNPMSRDAPACSPLEKTPARPKKSIWATGGNEERYLRFKPSTSLGAWLEEPHFLYDRAWTVVAEHPGIGRGPDDTFQEEAAQRIAENGFQANVHGRGGTGKSWLLTLVKKKAEAAGWVVDVLAFTHVQAANVDGATILHHLHAKAGSKKHLIIIDEESQVPLRLWAALANFKFTGSRFVVLGDVAGQLPPIADRHREELWATIDDSRFMHELCGGLRVELHKFRRGGDQAHFDLVGSIYPSTGTTLGEALEKVREKYPVHRPQEQCDTILCLSNKCRKEVNTRHNDFHATVDSICVKADTTTATRDDGSQDMKLWPGIVLQAAVSDRKQLKNALRYKVLEVTEETCTMVRINDEGTTAGEPFTMATKEVPKKLRLTYAITYDSSQARTLYGRVRLVQTDHRHMTLRRLIVGLGRAPEGSQLEVE
jgi:hypothetical protein